MESIVKEVYKCHLKQNQVIKFITHGSLELKNLNIIWKFNIKVSYSTEVSKLGYK